MSTATLAAFAKAYAETSQSLPFAAQRKLTILSLNSTLKKYKTYCKQLLRDIPDSEHRLKIARPEMLVLPKQFTAVVFRHPGIGERPG